jgi:hypothetical protein
MICDDCGQDVADTTTIDGQEYCNECRDSNYSVCDRCKEWYPADQTEIVIVGASVSHSRLYRQSQYWWDRPACELCGAESETDRVEGLLLCRECRIGEIESGRGGPLQ